MRKGRTAGQALLGVGATATDQGSIAILIGLRLDAAPVAEIGGARTIFQADIIRLISLRRRAAPVAAPLVGGDDGGIIAGQPAQKIDGLVAALAFG